LLPAGVDFARRRVACPLRNPARIPFSVNAEVYRKLSAWKAR
jgi:hypothetical protein